MRLLYVLRIAIWTVGLSGAVFAQSSSVFGGLSYLRGSTDLFPLASNSRTLLGWDASYTYHVVPRFGFTADVTGNYGSVRKDSLSFGQRDDKIHTFLGGPEVQALKLGRVDVNLRALAGASVASSPRYNAFAFGNSVTAFTASFGGSIDVRITRHVLWRVVEPEYLLTRFDGGYQGSVRAATGFVYQFGFRE